MSVAALLLCQGKESLGFFSSLNVEQGEGVHFHDKKKRGGGIPISFLFPSKYRPKRLGGGLIANSPPFSFSSFSLLSCLLRMCIASRSVGRQPASQPVRDTHTDLTTNKYSNSK